jgi:hypothetical protein
MGNFLAFSSVIGKTKDDVVASLADYAKSVRGGLQPENNTKDGCAVIEENNNTTVLYPTAYVEWDNSSEFISKKLKATVFSFHIHDGDLWMYVLYHNGKIVDKFNPILIIGRMVFQTKKLTVGRVMSKRSSIMSLQ